MAPDSVMADRAPALAIGSLRTLLRWLSASPDRGGRQQAAGYAYAMPGAGETPGPAKVLQLDLARPLPEVSLRDGPAGQPYDRVISLVRLHQQPLGLLELRVNDRVTPAQLKEAIWRRLREDILAHLSRDGLDADVLLGSHDLPDAGAAPCRTSRERMLSDGPFVSIVIPTRNRPQGVVRSLRSLGHLRYPHFEVIVVDNDPDDDATARVVRDWQASFPLAYVIEKRRGVSSARNRGLAAARGELVAFIDDDTAPDEHWLTEIVSAFDSDARVGCVTGLILPDELDTPAQLWFEQFSRLEKGFSRRIFDLDQNRPNDPLFPYNAGTFGSGANLAFRTAVLRQLGGFDPVLGTGTPALGGEDLEICFRLIQYGWQICYEPSSLVYHSHQKDYDVLRYKTYCYGVGLSAFITKCVWERPKRVFEVIERLPRGLAFLLSPRSPKNRPKGPGYPRELSIKELEGVLYGPMAYIKSRLAGQAR